MDGQKESSRPDTLLLQSSLNPTHELARLVHEQGASLLYREPSTGRTPLHVAAQAGAEEQVRWFLANGALWNLVDNNSFTPAELALSEGHKEIHDIIFDAAVEQEWRRLYGPPKKIPGTENLDCVIDVDTSNQSFMKGRVHYTDARSHTNSELDSFAMVAESGTGVMMEWARPIMKETAHLLFDGMRPGASCLNIGFGMGVIDSYFQSYAPGHHTIIEAHPDALAYMRETGWYDKPNVRILEGLWQDFINDDMDSSFMGRFDVVYFDTFEEGYRAFMNFWKRVPGLLRGPQSRLSFFYVHARGNPFAYKVYSAVSGKHLSDLGLDTVWHDVHVDPKTVWFSYADAEQKKESEETVQKETHPWRIPICTPHAPKKNDASNGKLEEPSPAVG